MLFRSVLVVTLYLSLSVGMLISTLSRDARGAMSGTFLVMLVLAAMMPVFWVLTISGKSSRGFEFLMLASPPHAFRSAFDNYYSGWKGARNFWDCILTMLAISTSCLLAASALLPRLWQESGEATREKRNWLRWPFAGWARLRKRIADQRLRDTRPFLWLATRDGRPRALAHWAFGVLTPVWVYLFVKLLIESSQTNRSSNILFVILMLTTFVMHLVLKCLVAAEASRRFSEDRASGALELLLVTPLRPTEIVASQFRGVWLSFRWCYLVLTLLNVALLMFVLRSTMFDIGNTPKRMFTMMLGGGLVFLFVDGFTLIKVGMWTAMTQTRHARAFMATVMRVLLPSWLGIVLFVFLISVGALNGINGTPEMTLSAYFILGGVTAFVAAGVATARLNKNFREIASLGKIESPLMPTDVD